MLTLRSLALLAAATLVASQTIESLDPCGQTCYNSVKAQAGTFNCAADNMSCLCAVADFKNGVHDCAKSACPAEYAGTVVAAVNALCATAVPAAPTPEPTTAAPAAPETTSTPPPEPLLTSTTPTSSNTEAPIATNTTPTASSTTLETSTTPAAAGETPTSTSTEEGAAKNAEPTTTSTTTASDTKTTSAPVSTQSNEPTGLPVAAKAGIGIGAGAAALALLGLAAWILARQRRNKRANGFSSKHMIKISDPAPGGGRAFAGDNHYETGHSELEMKSRRYEDMVPRQQPRHMV